MSGCLARFCSRSSGVRDRRAPDYATRHLKVVAWEGSAPSISGCRPDVMLFHHQAVEARLSNTGCLAWICTKTVGVKARHAAVTPRGNEWWPARVTRPVPRIKSPLHHFNAYRPMMVLAAGLAPALATLSTSCLCIGLREQMEWGLQPGLHRQGFFTKEIRRLLHGGRNGRSLRCRPGHSGLMKPT